MSLAFVALFRRLLDRAAEQLAPSEQTDPIRVCVCFLVLCLWMSAKGCTMVCEIVVVVFFFAWIFLSHFPFEGAITTLSCCGEFIGTGGADGSVWTGRAGERGVAPKSAAFRPAHRGAVVALALSRAWHVAVSAASDASILLWELRGPRPIRQVLTKGNFLFV